MSLLIIRPREGLRQTTVPVSSQKLRLLFALLNIIRQVPTLLIAALSSKTEDDAGIFPMGGPMLGWPGQIAFAVPARGTGRERGLSSSMAAIGVGDAGGGGLDIRTVASRIRQMFEDDRAPRSSRDVLDTYNRVHPSAQIDGRTCAEALTLLENQLVVLKRRIESREFYCYYDQLTEINRTTAGLTDALSRATTLHQVVAILRFCLGRIGENPPLFENVDFYLSDLPAGAAEQIRSQDMTVATPGSMRIVYRSGRDLSSSWFDRWVPFADDRRRLGGMGVYEYLLQRVLQQREAGFIYYPDVQAAAQVAGGPIFVDSVTGYMQAFNDPREVFYEVLKVGRGEGVRCYGFLKLHRWKPKGHERENAPFYAPTANREAVNEALRNLAKPVATTIHRIVGDGSVREIWEEEERSIAAVQAEEARRSAMKRDSIFTPLLPPPRSRVTLLKVGGETVFAETFEDVRKSCVSEDEFRSITVAVREAVGNAWGQVEEQFAMDRLADVQKLIILRIPGKGYIGCISVRDLELSTSSGRRRVSYVEMGAVKAAYQSKGISSKLLYQVIRDKFFEEFSRQFVAKRRWASFWNPLVWGSLLRFYVYMRTGLLGLPKSMRGLRYAIVALTDTPVALGPFTHYVDRLTPKPVTPSGGLPPGLSTAQKQALIVQTTLAAVPEEHHEIIRAMLPRGYSYDRNRGVVTGGTYRRDGEGNIEGQPPPAYAEEVTNLYVDGVLQSEAYQGDVPMVIDVGAEDFRSYLLYVRGKQRQQEARSSVLQAVRNA